MLMISFDLFLTIFCSLISLTNFLSFGFAAHDTITPTESIKDGNNTLISAGRVFELGFFSPGKSKNRYLGIWYKSTPDLVVWVANRNNPLSDKNGEFTIRSGNLVLLNATISIVWSSNLTGNIATNPIALLLDSGNLVLKNKDQGISDEVIQIWQSFDYPTDTLLAGMKLGWDLNAGLERYLTSWKSVDDPSSGDYTYKMHVNGLPQVVLEMGSTKKFRTGTWNGVRFSGQQLLIDTIFKTVYTFDDDEAYLKFEHTVDSAVSLVKMEGSGLAQRLVLQNGSTKWDVMYSIPTDQQCASYGSCGANSICTTGGTPLCECLKGFTPRSPQEWTAMIYSKGCKRNLPLDCASGDGFVRIVGLKLPDLLVFRLDKNMSLKECREACSKNCSCMAYANSDVRRAGSGCLMWFGDLIDMNEIHVKGSEQEIYIRLSASEITIHDDKKRERMKTILVPSLTVASCIFGIACWGLTWKLRRRVKGKSMDESIELPIFDLATIITATKNFSLENMIGQGGFGPVYKGNLSTGQEIAVKRLSNDSGQGLKEFKNEVELIAKLQHRNLVALNGCCIQGEERILVYEYMPNKSLDHYIFDRKGTKTLHWEKYFDIVKGIARGLLYLHEDSKLQIVHRDLKASNILLDNNLNPKISDFGLARTFGDDEKELKTRRVVGTFGYMAPEYAIDGKFSTKSDVFSFGVVLLEIVSGKKNRSFKHPDHNHNLLGHVWLLWIENRALDLMDECLKESCVESQVLRCIQVGLLCVQKFPRERPTMSSVVFILENEVAVLPQPKEPAFFVERSSNSSECSRTEDSSSLNTMTITMLSGRP